MRRRLVDLKVSQPEIKTQTFTAQDNIYVAVKSIKDN